MLALALVSLVLRLGDDAAVETTPVSCKTTLSETALLEKNSSGVLEGSVEDGAGGKISDLGGVGTRHVRIRHCACMKFVWKIRERALFAQDNEPLRCRIRIRRSEVLTR